MVMQVWSGGFWGGGDARDPGSGRTDLGGNKRDGVILVVDDDASILETVTSILDQEGYEAVGVEGGAEAVAFARVTRPTLILLDMRMPNMDGWAVARSLRESGISVPIVVMTAAENARRWADEIDAAGHLTKPFTLDELLEVVERHRRDPRRN